MQEQVTALMQSIVALADGTSLVGSDDDIGESIGDRPVRKCVEAMLTEVRPGYYDPVILQQ